MVRETKQRLSGSDLTDALVYLQMIKMISRCMDALN